MISIHKIKVKMKSVTIWYSGKTLSTRHQITIMRHAESRGFESSKRPKLSLNYSIGHKIKITFYNCKLYYFQNVTTKYLLLFDNIELFLLPNIHEIIAKWRPNTEEVKCSHFFSFSIKLEIFHNSTKTVIIKENFALNISLL